MCLLDYLFQAWTAAEEVVLSVTIDPGPLLLMEELHKACKNQFPITRSVSYLCKIIYRPSQNCSIFLLLQLWIQRDLIGFH